MRIGITFALVTFAWVFFRANSLNDALYVISHVFVSGSGGLTDAFGEGLLGAHAEFILSWGLIGLVLVSDWLIARYGFDELLRVSPVYVRWAAYYAVGAAVVFSGLYGVGAQKFIYFQF